MSLVSPWSMLDSRVKEWTDKFNKCQTQEEAEECAFWCRDMDNWSGHTGFGTAVLHRVSENAEHRLRGDVYKWLKEEVKRQDKERSGRGMSNSAKERKGEYMNSEDLASQMKETWESIGSQIDETSARLEKTVEEIMELFDNAGGTDEDNAAEDDNNENDATADDREDDNEDDDDGDVWDEARDKMDGLMDSFHDTLDSTLDGAQEAIGNLLDTGDKDATADDGDTVLDNFASMELASMEFLIADTLSQAAGVFSTAVIDSLGLINKFVEQSMDIVQKAQEQEGGELAEGEKEMLDNGKKCIIAFNSLMQRGVKSGVNALQGMLKSYADAVKGKEEGDED